MTAPTSKHDPFSGRVEIRLYGKPLNWSHADTNAATLERIADVAIEMKVHNLFAPKASAFNAKICLPEELNQAVYCGGTPVKLKQGVEADGVVIPVGEAFYLPSADCLTVVAIDPKSGMTIAAHAGRDCLMDRKRINGEGKSHPEHESVIDAIVAKFEAADVNPKYLKVYMTCGIGPKQFIHDYHHDRYREANTKMVMDVIRKWGPQCLDGDMMKGKLVLTEIVRAQLIRHGVAPYNIGFDVVDTYADVDAEGKHLWWSYRREPGPGRNAVIIKRVY